MPAACIYELARRFAEEVLLEDDKHPKISFAPTTTTRTIGGGDDSNSSSVSLSFTSAPPAASAAHVGDTIAGANPLSDEGAAKAESQSASASAAAANRPVTDDNVMTRGMVNFDQFLRVCISCAHTAAVASTLISSSDGGGSDLQAANLPPFACRPSTEMCKFFNFPLTYSA